MSNADQTRADQLHDEARALDDDDEALRLYQEVLRLDPDRPATLYNIGLIHKYRGQWAESLTFNRRAVQLAPDEESANWNLAIAATALRDWRTARQTWKRLGIAVEEGESPIEDDFGVTPVRLNPDGDAEVVWGRRIDPVRVRIDNIPYPASGFRCGDVVLHDGAPVGERESQGRTYSVFNVLELFEASSLSTYEAEVRGGTNSDLGLLIAALTRAGVAHEDWSTNVRMLCKQCSEGQVHDRHDHALSGTSNDRHILAVASADPNAAKAVLASWTGGSRKLLRFELKLAPPARH